MTLPQGGGFRHEALFYAGKDEFIDGTLPFIRDGVADGEPVLVAVSKARARALEAALDEDARYVHFLDMETVGRNPACIIPAWREFLQDHMGAGRRLRGIGEPIWPGRTPAELVECHTHEFLLNVAFADAAGFWLLCPYDVASLQPEVVVQAKRSHPYIANGARGHASHVYVGPEHAPGPFDGELPAPAARPQQTAFARHDIRAVRKFVARCAAAAGLVGDRAEDLVLAVSELATNSVTHGGGHGSVHVWRDGRTVICEVRDDGRLQHPLVGRERPLPEQATGRGLWLVNHLCDLVQMRALAGGNVVRVHMALA